MGHALSSRSATRSCAWQRMQGFNVLVPARLRPRRDLDAGRGREAARAGGHRPRQELGREAFEARVWEWLREYGGKIIDQFRRSARRSTTGASASRWTTATCARSCASSCTCTTRAGCTAQPDHQLVPVPRDVALGPRARARGRRRHAHDDPLPVRGRLRHRSRSRPSGRRRSSPTSPSRCIRTTSATATLVGRRRSSRSSSGACR